VIDPELMPLWAFSVNCPILCGWGTSKSGAKETFPKLSCIVYM